MIDLAPPIVASDGREMGIMKEREEIGSQSLILKRSSL
jgi:hypothetical protein